MDIFLLFVAICAAFIYANIIEKRRRRDSEELLTQISSLTSRLFELEKRQLSQPPPARPVAMQVPPPVTVSPVIAPPVRPAPEPPNPVTPPVAPAPVAPLQIRVEPAPLASAAKITPPPVTRPEPLPSAAPLSAAPPAAASHREPPPMPPKIAPLQTPSPSAPLSMTEKALSTGSMEWKIGTNLLPKIGIVLLVLGLAWLAAFLWSSIPRVLRIVLLYSIGPGLLGTGIFLEAKENFKTLARMLIGGGWAWTFTMTLFIYWLPPVKIVDSPVVDLFLLLIVATAMVWHTLKYNSQAVTAAAFFLAFLGMAVTPETGVFSPVAGAILIAGMTGIVLRRNWFELEIFGILAAYLSHIWWLYQIFLKVPDHAREFPDSTGSLIIVVCYWAVFRVSYLMRKVANSGEEKVSTVAALLNPLLFLAVMKYQSLHPAWAFYALLAMGAVEFILGQLPPARRRKMPFYILSSLGAALMVAAVPFKYARSHALEILWLVGAEAFLLAGVFAVERLFRQFAGIISFLVAGYLLVTEAPAFLRNLGDAQALQSGRLSLIFALAALVFYFNCHVIGRYRTDLFDRESEIQAIGALSFLGSIFAVGAIYSFFSLHMVAVALGLLVALLSWAGRQFRIPQTIYQAHWIAVASFADVCVNGLALKKTLWHGFPEIILTFGSVAALLYLSSRFVRLSETRGREVASVLYKWAATTLLAVLIWYWAPDWLVAVYWAALGLALALVAQWRKRVEFNWQALVLGLLASGYALAVNLQFTGPAHQLTKGLSHRLVSMTVIAGIVYLLTRWAPVEQLKPVASWAGTIVLGALIWREAPKQWTAVVWICLAACLALAARFWKERPLLWQCHLVSVVALVWMAATNFQPEYSGKWQLIIVLFTAAVYYALTWITNVAGIIGDEWVAQSYSWAGSLLISWLIWYQRQAPHEHERALYWAVFGLLLFEIGYQWKPAFLRAQGYVALLSSFVYIFFANFNVRPGGLLDPGVITVLPLVPLYFWTYHRLHIKEAQP